MRGVSWESRPSSAPFLPCQHGPVALSEFVSPSDEQDYLLSLVVFSQSLTTAHHLYVLDAVPLLVTASKARHRPGSPGALQAARRGTVVSQLMYVHIKFETAVEVLRTKCVWSLSGKTAYSGRSR